MNFQLNRLPLDDVLLLARETHSDTEKSPLVGGVWLGVAFVLDLFQRFGGGAVKLELEDIDVIVGLNDDVGSSS